MRLRSLCASLLTAALLVPVGATSAAAAGSAGTTAGPPVSPYKSAATQRAKRTARAARVVVPPPAPPPPSPPPPAPALAVPTYADRVLALTNAERASRGLRPLALSPCADGYADSWAARLAAVGTLSHQPLSPILSSCRARRVGENVAAGAMTADRMVAMWMASSGHRANLLNAAYTHLGVGAVPTSSGTVFGVQVFLAL